jgi:hypothetical protein
MTLDLPSEARDRRRLTADEARLRAKIRAIVIRMLLGMDRP